MNNPKPQIVPSRLTVETYSTRPPRSLLGEFLKAAPSFQCGVVFSIEPG